jgi:hypothetical protein
MLVHDEAGLRPATGVTRPGLLCLGVIIALLSGCYEYLPVAATPELTGREVQLSLTDSGSAVLAPLVGYGIEAVDGTLVSDSDMRYRVAVTSIRRRDGQESDWNGESVNIPHSVVSTIMERRFSRARSTLFAAATTMAMVVARRAFGGTGGATTPGGNQSGGTGPR